MLKRFVLIAPLVIFLLAFPLVNSIDFYQNDDWVYYETVKNFLNSDLTLHPYVGPTFFVQGLLAVTFSTLFSLEKLPILTFLVSIANFYLLVGILIYFHKKKPIEAILYGLIFGLNPLTTYLTLGFMTGAYFVFFMLLSIFSYLYYEQTKIKWVFALSLFVSFLGLLVRQVSLIIPLSIFLYSFYKKRYKDGLIALLTFVGFYVYYSYIFPQTPRIIEVPLQYHHLLDLDYVFSTLYGVGIVLTAFLFPLFLNLIRFRMTSGKFLLFFALAIILYIAFNTSFEPQKLAWDEFPYFQNTFERTGLYPRGIAGTKYQFKYNFDLYRYWNLASKLLLAVVLSYFIVFRKKLINFYSILIATYLFLTLIVETFYDRYIYILVPLVIFCTASITSKVGKLKMVVFAGFALFMVFFSYQLANDFVLVNKYVWERSKQLVSQGVRPNKIHGTNAWKLTFRNTDRIYDYYFSYDSPEINRELLQTHSLVESHEIEFPFNLFINPNIYLYSASSFVL